MSTPELPEVGRSAKIDYTPFGEVFYLTVKIDDEYEERFERIAEEEVNEKLAFLFVTAEPEALWDAHPEEVCTSVLLETGEDRVRSLNYGLRIETTALEDQGRAL